jgi:transposase-like protein
MSRLIALIDDYKDRHGQPSDSSIARAIDVAPQTINSWRKRGLRELPASDTLERLADFLLVDYEGVVLRAALMDTGWLPDQEPRGSLDEARSTG